ncbi:MAG TPA: hypothetical protein VEG35_05980, partial [Burkholderiales bacterium]|nr:hypothetical protein [Burkholderiales bacterium]
MKKSNWLGVALSAAVIVFFLTWGPANADKNPTQVSVINTAADPVPVNVTNPSHPIQPITLHNSQPSLDYDVPAGKIFVIEYLSIYANVPIGAGQTPPDTAFRIQVSNVGFSLTTFPYTEHIRDLA